MVFLERGKGTTSRWNRLLAYWLAHDEEVRSRVVWLLFFRTLIISILLLATVGLRLGSGQPIFGGASVFLYIVCGLSYGTVLLGALWIRYQRSRAIIPLAYMQLVGDCALSTVLVIATGGFESAFVFLFSLTILNAAAVLGRSAAMVLAATNTVIYTSLLALQVGSHLDFAGLVAPNFGTVFPSFLANVLAFFLVAILSASLTDQLRRTSESLDEARETLEEANEHHETILESLPSGVLTVDVEGRVTFVNRAGSEILRHREETLLGANLKTLLPELELDDNPPRFEVVMGDGQVLGGSVAALFGSQLGRAVVFQDLTELRVLQSELQRAERLQTLGRFAAGMAHELRNPLAAMIGCLELMASDAREGLPPSADGERMLGIVNREAHRLEALVSDFLTYARPAPPEIKPLTLGPLLKDCLALVESSSDVDIRFQASEESLTVRGDRAQLEQVIWNLVGNACQAARGEMGGEKPSHGGEVLVTLRAENGRALVHIDDNGPGIAAEHLPHIFEPFFTTRPAGTGLGLATSHQFVLSQGGDLSVTTSPLGGARFSVRLPLLFDGAPPMTVPADKATTTQSAGGR